MLADVVPVGEFDATWIGGRMTTDGQCRWSMDCR